MTHEEMIAVIAAHRDGKTIQFQPVDIECGWQDTGPDVVWSFNTDNYRIKPEPPKPRELWIYENERGSFAGYPLTKSKPKQDVSRKGRYVKFAEVLPEPMAKRDPVDFYIEQTEGEKPASKPIAYITRESLMRLQRGGNDSRGSVPVHAERSNSAKFAVYLDARSAKAGKP